MFYADSNDPTLYSHTIWQKTVHIYRISSDIRQIFFSFQNNPKDLDPSYKTDVDLWDCFGRTKLVL